MATCFHCKTQETQLYENGVPICIACANGRDKKAKQDHYKTAPSADGIGHSTGAFLKNPDETKQYH